MASGSARAAVRSGGSAVTVRLEASGAPSAGRPTPLSCIATDSVAVSEVLIDAAGPDGVRVAVPIASTIQLGGGSVQAEAAWVPTRSGMNQVRCTAFGVSTAGATGAAAITVPVASPRVPVITRLAPVAPAVLVGRPVEVEVEASDPEGGTLRYSWSASVGAVSGSGRKVTWTAPATEGVFPVQVNVTDDTGLVTTQVVQVQVSPAVYQGTARASLYGPRRVAAVDDGSFFIVDGDRRLHKLTKRGDFMATALDGVRSVASGGGLVFAGMQAGEVVKIDPASGRIVGRIDLGVSAGPVGLAYDSVRELLWMGFSAGGVQARRLDGSLALQIRNSSAGALVRVADVAVDAAAGIVWVAQDRAAAGGMIFGYRATDGVQVSVIGADGSGPARMTGALAVGAGGQLFVSDAFSGKVQVLSSTGTPVRTLGRPGKASGELARPAGMAFMANGDLLVANFDVNRMDRFGNETPLPTCDGDRDCDGIADADEAAAGLDPDSAADALVDGDADGLNNAEEVRNGTNLAVADTDGDGFVDGAEVAAGFDPLTAGDHVAHLTASAASGGPGLVRLSGTIGGLAGEAACSQSWRQTDGPQVALDGGSGLAPSFVARKAGTYRFAFDAVCDGIPAVGTVASVVIDNVAPAADAGRVVVVAEGSRLQLNSAATTDANGDSLAFAWEQVAGRPVTGAVSGRTLTARFGAAGAYAFAMTATDSGGAAAVAEAQVVVVGSTPVPAASVVSPVLAVVSQTVTLDAGGSFAAPGAVFTWQQVAGAQVALSGQGTSRASFQAPSAGRYAFQVAIQQGSVRSPAAQVEVFVAPVGGGLPVAVATAPAISAVNAEVALDGSASTGSGSLGFAWRQVSGPAAGLRNANRAKADAYFFAPGSYVFELSVADEAATALPARVAIEVRDGGKPVPVASAIAQSAAVVGERVMLDGSGSVGAKTFRWTQVAGPWVAVQGGARAAFVAPAAGRYGFELEVDDGLARSAPVRVDVVVTQNGMEN